MEKEVIMKKLVNEKDKRDFPGYPYYGKKQDIYKREKEEVDIDPETKKLKTENEKINFLNEKDFDEDVSGSDLDIPGTELDDELEEIGSEDEENNLYSLGGDNNQEDNSGDKI